MDALRPDALLAPVHTLAVLARSGSYTAAAQRLGLSKAAVSQRITELERQLGVLLVQRTTRSLRLTQAGERLVAETAEGWGRIEQALLAVRDLAGEPRGLVRLTAPVALGRQHLAPLLPEFLRAHPSIAIDLDLSDRLVALAQEGFDLAVRHVGAPPDNHVAWLLGPSRTLLVASRAYLKRRGTPRHPEALAEHDCIAYLRQGPTVWRFEAQDAAEPVRGRRRPVAAAGQRLAVTVQGPLRANNSEVLREAVLAGLGIALVPDFSAAAALRAGRLQALLPDWRPVGFFGEGLYAIRPWSAQAPRAVQEVVGWLRLRLPASLAGGG